MKCLLFILTFCFVSSWTYANTVEFSAEDFQRLSRQDQVAFVAELRDLVANMSHDHSLFSRFNEKWQKYFVAVLGESAEAQVTYTVRKANADGYDFAEAAMEEFRKVSNGKTVLGDHELGHAKRAMNFLYSESLKIANGSSADKEKMRRTVQALLDEVSRFKVDRKTTDHASIDAKATGIAKRLSVNIRVPVFRQAELIESTTRVADSGSSRSVGSSIPVTKVLVTDVAKVSSTTRIETQKVETDGNKDYSACMFGGFILKTIVCKAPRELPEDLKAFKIFDQKKFKCTRGELICNPVLFGFEWPEGCDAKKDQERKDCYKEARPVCVTNTVKATANCKEKTKNTKYPERAAALSADFPKVLESFLKDFKKLCYEDSSGQNRFIHFDSSGNKRSNPEYFKTDILTTCGVAKTHWIEISQKYQFKLPGGKNGVPAGGAKDGRLAPGTI